MLEAYDIWKQSKSALMTKVKGRTGKYHIVENNACMSVEFYNKQEKPEGIYRMDMNLTDRKLGKPDTKFNKIVILKALKQSKFEDRPPELIERELNISLSIKHENIVEFYKLLSTDKDLKKSSEIFLVMEYCSLGSSMDYSESKQRYVRYDKSTAPCFSFDEGLQIILPIIQALIYLHDKKIAHLDLKPQNILITSAKCNKILPKLTDFGVSRQLKKNESMICVEGGTKYFFSPERMNEELDPFKDDVWGIGTTLYTLVTGKILKEDGFEFRKFRGMGDTEGQVELFKKDIIKIVTMKSKKYPWLSEICNIDADKRPGINTVSEIILLNGSK